MDRRVLLWFGIATYTVLILFTILFYKERMVFNDAAYHLFSILDENGFAIQNHRFVAVLTQSFPLIVARLGGSLEAIAIIYSLSFELVYFGVFLLLLLGFKNKQLAIAYLLFCTLMVRHTFFWCLSEVVQGTSVYFIYLAFWLRVYVEGQTAPRLFQRLIMLSLLILLVFSHPLMPFCVLFGSVFFYLYFKQRETIISKSIVQHGILFIVFYLLRSLLLKTSNDTTAFSELVKGLRYLVHYFDMPGLTKFIHYFRYDYYLVSFITACVVSYYFFKKEFVFLVFFSVSFIGYALMVALSDWQGSEQFYAEYRYLFLSVFVIFPLVFHLLPQVRNTQYQSLLIILSVVFSIIQIYNWHPTYLKRTLWHRNLMTRTRDFENKKLIVVPNEGTLDSLKMYWGVPYEMWLISTIETGESRSVIVEEEKNQYDESLKQTSEFQTRWSMVEYSFLHSPYFRFNDSTTTYVKY